MLMYMFSRLAIEIKYIFLFYLKFLKMKLCLILIFVNNICLFGCTEIERQEKKRKHGFECFPNFRYIAKH